MLLCKRRLYFGVSVPKVRVCSIVMETCVSGRQWTISNGEPNTFHIMSDISQCV